MSDANVGYRHNDEHLYDELRWLDQVLAAAVTAFRQKMQAAPAPAHAETAANRQIFISHTEVDWLLDPHCPDLTVLADDQAHLAALRQTINAKVQHSLQQGIFIALPQLALIFGLSELEMQMIVIALAPELARKYDRIYAYLQDDITRKRPSVDLVLSLLCSQPAARWRLRTAFAEQAPLLRAEILHLVDDLQNPSGSSDLGRFVQVTPRLLSYLLGNNQPDGRLLDYIRLLPPTTSLEQVWLAPALKRQLATLLQHHFGRRDAPTERLVFYFHGREQVGKRTLAHALCGELACPLLYVDVELLAGEDLPALLRLILREGLLLQAAICLDHLDGWLEEEQKAKGQLKRLAQLAADYGWLLFLCAEKPLPTAHYFAGITLQQVELPTPEATVRQLAWQQALVEQGVADPDNWAQHLAAHFRLTPGQIRGAVADARQEHRFQQGEAPLALSDLYGACRRQSNQKLGELAARIDPRQGWAALVLPSAQMVQLQEICSQVRQRTRVFTEWGFDQKLTYGKGLSVLFSGPPGTGKTLAAEVIAHELQLALYTVDLSSVVSKYIGETEKNLSKIFQEAENSNAILFFDEADALFGKRTEVSDAHDRYANIETSYLLQRMEKYEGVVILATNLRENMDEAFTRRIRVIVEFPFPDEASRLQIWQRHFPAAAPLDDAVDFAYLARQFKIAGGNIKNIVLNSAFLAAENGRVIGMEHLLQGAKREFEKIGRVWNTQRVK